MTNLPPFPSWYNDGTAKMYVDLEAWMQPYADTMSQILHRIQPDILWTIFYLLILTVTYLFHSPFRSHSASTTDGYARCTRVIQTWGMTVLLGFHFAPRFFQQKQEQPALSGNPQEAVASIFFPLLTSLPLLFLFIHKMKRHWHLGVTYGANLSSILLNSIVLAMVASTHYAYCEQLYSNMQPRWQQFFSPVRVMFHPTSVHEHPFLALAQQLSVCLLFLMIDYQYKKMKGFDPSRGILWSELFNLKKDREARPESLLLKQRDWRTLVPIPKMFSKKSTARSSSRRTSAAPNSTTAPSATLASPITALRRRVPLFFSQLYRESALEVSPEALMETMSPLSDPGRDDSVAAPGGRRTTSFAPSALEVREILSAKHPVNKPGMVAWWSTFVLSTAWQAAAGASLGFLSFDVRTIQYFLKPKVFTLTFSSKLHGPGGASLRGGGDSDQLRSCGSAEDNESAGSPLVAGDDYTSRTVSNNQSTTSCNLQDDTTTTDVWFDWIADVGDGFNPTYEMARLLAQPRLDIKESRGDWSEDEAGLLISFDNPAPTFTGSADSKARGAANLPSALLPSVRVSTPTGKKPSSSTSDWLVDDSSPTVPYGAAGAEGRSSHRAANADDIAHPEPLPRLRRATSFSGSPSRIPSGSGSGGGAGGGKSSIGPGGGGGGVLRGRQSTFSLPRGSFVLLGGDLAYPSPNDETYQSRLFEPYRDALCGNYKLQKLFHREQQRIVVQDETDRDMAHIRMLDAATVAGIAMGDDPLRSSRGTAEEALRSIPMLFSIPGNHDWFDGLTTFRKYILEKTWIGGWLMPQRSSFFLLKLPHNWFIICCDTGTTEDIDTAQRNYFLDCIEKYMDGESCVILTAHQPGWLFNAMDMRSSPVQPEIDRVVLALGSRLRLHIAGDIHYYSRHTPIDPLSQAATLIVSGGGGAYLYGARDDKIIAQGTAYTRAGAFPRKNTYMSIATRLWGFRVVNWKFDIIIGVLCFGLIYSMLPLPLDPITHTFSNVDNIPGLASYWFNSTVTLVSFLFSNSFMSLFPFFFYFLCFSSAGANRKAPLWWRGVYGLFWTMCVVVASCGMLAFLSCGILSYMRNNGMILSTRDKWSSLMDIQVRRSSNELVDNAKELLGLNSTVSVVLGHIQESLWDSCISRVMSVIVRALDPIETLAYLSMVISSSEIGQFNTLATRSQIMFYYIYLLLFYWILVTPLVSFIIGTFLFISVTVFDYMYDGAYSAFQIEDYKHFLRFKIDRNTRELHCFVVGEQKVPKMWELDPRHAAGFDDAEHKDLPPHLRRSPSRWTPVSSVRNQKPPEAEILEHFVIHPHRVRTKDLSPPEKDH